MRDFANILLVDDRPARLLTYEDILERLGHNLVRASSGAEALARLGERDYAAILLDVSLSGMDGFETAARIRAHPIFGGTPILFVTDEHLNDREPVCGSDLGTADYIYRPVIPHILRGKMQMLVRLFHQRREVGWLNERLAAAKRQLADTRTRLRDENTRKLQALTSTLEFANSRLISEVAERKRAEALLREAARRKDEFISILAHELRNPLAAMQSGVDLLGQPQLRDSMLPWASDLLGRQLRHLTRLIDDLLDVSRVSSGRMQLKRERLDLREVIEHSFDTVRALIEEKGHAVAVTLPAAPAFVHGDSVRLTQVFGNLLTNAAKFTPRNGSICLTVEIDTENSTIAVCVRDNGEGIAPDMLGRIFELFTQAGGAESYAHGGLGIGLALVRGLIEMHGGTVDAVSGGPGVGSEFRVRLPLAEAPEHAAEVANGAQPAVAEGLKLLIVDDNVDLAHGLSAYLTAACRHEVRVEHSGAAGIEAAASFQPDVVLLDIGLPDINGFDVARRLRAAPESSGVPLLALSGFSSDDDRERAATAGFDRYFVKPVRFDALVRALGELTRRVGGAPAAAPTP